MAGDAGRGAAGKPAPGKPGPKCPVCGRPAAERFRPFCSAGCRDRDLLNWLGGRYAIPARESEPDGEDDPGEG